MALVLGPAQALPGSDSGDERARRQLSGPALLVAGRRNSSSPRDARVASLVPHRVAGRAGEPRHLPDALRPGRDEASATRGGPPSAVESALCAPRPAPCAPRPASPARARPRRALRPCASATSRTRALPVSPAAFAKYKTRNSNLNTPSPGCGPWPRQARGTRQGCCTPGDQGCATARGTASPTPSPHPPSAWTRTRGATRVSGAPGPHGSSQPQRTGKRVRRAGRVTEPAAKPREGS